MRGYYGTSEDTAAVLDADGWLRTGDLATMDEQGYCRIVVRPDDRLEDEDSPRVGNQG
jgi:long-subunit acyl-CoA synthetase (AMP-forming)